MAIGELTMDLPVPGPADVAASCGGCRWSVARSGWKKVLPDLPDEVIDLLATPVVVRAAPLAAGTGLTRREDHRANLGRPRAVAGRPGGRR